MEREEAIMAVQAVIDAEWMMEADDMGFGELEELDEQRMERDMDDDIPNADTEREGLIEEGEERLGEGDISDEEAYLGWYLDDETPDVDHGWSEQEGEYQRADSEEENSNEGGSEIGRPRFVDIQGTSTPNNEGEFGLPHFRSEYETDTQWRSRRRWSSGGSESGYESVAFEDIDPRAAVTWQRTRRRRFGRITPGHMGEPGDSLD